MATLSAAQIAAVALEGGFLLNEERVTAVAIALAESGGNTLATHKNTNGSTDYGLWQINSVHRNLLRQYTWSNPTDNARMAYALYTARGNKFTDWVAYTSGRHLAFLSVARRAVYKSGSPLPSGNAAAGTNGAAASTTQASGLPLNPVSPLAGIIDLVQLITNPHTWLRVGMFLGGLALLYMGIKGTITLDNKISALGRQAAVAVATRGGSAASKAKVAG